MKDWSTCAYTLIIKPELSTGDGGVIVVPEVVADGSPVSPEADLQGSGQLLLALRQFSREET